MATPHLAAEKGSIAPTVLLPGDPLRAKYLAENYLQDYVCYNTVRNMFGYTGTYKGVKVSVQGTGMGIPSCLIYSTELIVEYGAKRLIRIGSCGSLQKNINVRDIVFAMSASTDSGINRRRFNGADFAPCADYKLFSRACAIADQLGYRFVAGNVLSGDQFYGDDLDAWKHWAQFGVLAVEMETNGLYTIAAKHGVQALSILSVSDSLVNREEIPAIEREKTLTRMMDIALLLAE